MTIPPPLPGAANITENGWASLEAAGRHALSQHIRWQVDGAIATYLSVAIHHQIDNAQSGKGLSGRKSMKTAAQLRRLAAKLSGDAAANALACAKAIESQKPRPRGRPRGWTAYPGLDDLILSLTMIYRGLPGPARSADWLAFLWCACNQLAGVPQHSPEAFAKRAETICEGLTPAALTRARTKHLKPHATRLKSTALGNYIASNMNYIAHASGRFANDVEAIRRYGASSHFGEAGHSSPRRRHRR